MISHIRGKLREVVAVQNEWDIEVWNETTLDKSRRYDFAWRAR